MPSEVDHAPSEADHTPSEPSAADHPIMPDEDLHGNQGSDEGLLIAALQRLDVATPRPTAPPSSKEAPIGVASDGDVKTQFFEYQSPPRSAGLRQAVLGPAEGGRGPQLHDDFVGESQHEDLTSSDVSGPGEECP